MKRPNLWTSALIMALALPGAALADEPLRPPADFVHGGPAATVRGDAARNRTTITQHGVPHSPSWSIPVWARWYSLSPMGDAILVLSDSGNLIGSRDPDQLVMTVWYLSGERPQARPFTLSEVMDPADMPRTVSHYAWLDSLLPGETGWTLKLSDGRTIKVTHR